MIQDAARPPLNASSALRLVALDLLENLRSDAQALLPLTALSTPGRYLYGHLANVSILSMHLGLRLGWTPNDILLLGVAALLHDLGAARLVPRGREAEEDRAHTLDGGGLAEHLQAVQTVEREVRAALSPLPGKSTPPGGLSLGAQILGIADLYEAMTHVRPWHSPALPHEALKTFVGRPVPEFKPQLVKFFIECLSLFPPGSYVRLTTGEIGRVVGIHHAQPTRPRIEIRVHPDGTRASPPVAMDLGTQPTVHVACAVDETKLDLQDLKLLLQFQAERWWTE